MKIKIIDLLNKIAEGKELPEKFMYKGHLYYRQKTKGICYRCDELNEIFEECLVFEDLNDTVEIIEEPKKIEKLEPVRGSDLSDLTDKDMILRNNALVELCKTLNNMNNKINELIDEINNLKEK